MPILKHCSIQVIYRLSPDSQTMVAAVAADLVVDPLQNDTDQFDSAEEVVLLEIDSGFPLQSFSDFDNYFVGMDNYLADFDNYLLDY